MVEESTPPPGATLTPPLIRALLIIVTGFSWLVP
jgi:hypothetical protein